MGGGGMVATTKYALTRAEVEELIRQEWTGCNSIAVNDVTTLRAMARAVGQRTYKEQFMGAGWWAFDYQGVHLFVRSGEVA